MPEVPKDPKFKEKGSKGFIKNPDGSINKTNYTNAMGDLHAAAMVIDELYPGWRETDEEGVPGKRNWIKNGKLKRGSMKNLKDLINFVENLPEHRRKEDEKAIMVDKAIAWANSDATKALEGLKMMEREWKKISNLDKYGQKPSYKRNVEDDQIEKNAPKKPKPVPPIKPDPPPQPPAGGGDKPVLTVNVSPKEGGRTTPTQDEAHFYKYMSEVFVQQQANDGFVFSHWLLDGNPVYDDVLEVLMDRNHTVFAVFEGGIVQPPPPPPPPTQFTITIRSLPFTGVTFAVDGLHTSHTNNTITVQPGQHVINILPKVNRGGKDWVFRQWNDGVTVPNRIEVVNADIVLVAQYEEEEEEEEEHPEPVFAYRGACRFLIDSVPMREVKVDVEVETSKLSDNDIRDHLEARYTTPAVWPGYLAGIKRSIKEVDDSGIEDVNEKFQILVNRLKSIGIRNPEGLANYVLTRRNWEKIDVLRNRILSARSSTNRITDPFNIRRPTGSLYRGRRGFGTPGITSPRSALPPNNIRNTLPRFAATGDEYLAGYGKNLIETNSYTVFELIVLTYVVELDENGREVADTRRPLKYKFTAQETVEMLSGAGTDGKQQAQFERWDIQRRANERENNPDIRSNPAERVIRSRRDNVESQWKGKKPEIEVEIGPRDRNILLTAYYTANVKHKRPGEMTSPYSRGGAYGRVGSAGARQDNLYGAYGSKAFAKGGIDRNREAEKAKFGKDSGYTSPSTRAAVNKGKRILNKYARAEYTRLFSPMNREFDARAEELRQSRQDARNARRELRNLLRQQVSFGQRLTGLLGQTDQDLINRATDTINSGVALATADAIQNARNRLEEFNKKYDTYFVDVKTAIESKSAQLESEMLTRADLVATQLARRFRMPLNGEDEVELASKLKQYASDIAEQFATRGRNSLFAVTRGLENLSRSMQVGSEMTYNLFENTFNFIFGPWTITTILALVMFFFTLSFVGYNVAYLWIFPAIGAIFTFLLNFSDSSRPLDWVTHLSSGAIIGYSAMLLLVALGALNWSFMSTFVFWIVWAVLGFLGVFQFYQHGGYKTVLQGAVIILIFSFVALGPYSAYYQQAIGQVKAPVEIAWRAISSAFTDIWLLATNPTEWYARQQLVNVRPEKPIDFPKGLEVTLLDALPPSVPGGREFAITTVIKNEGSIKAPALDASLSFGCNQWCIVPAPDPALAQSPYSLCHDNGYLFEEYYCGTDCGSNTPDPGDPVNVPVDACIPSCISKETGLGVVNKCLTRDRDTFLRNFGHVTKMERGEAKSINVRGFTAVSQSGRQGETRLAKVTVNLSYRYSTSTSLQTEVMTEDEINRKIQENEPVFHNVLAVTKSSPAQLSLNVGPQPLVAGQKSLLLVSVSNTREESSVVLKRGTIIRINMPKIVGTGLECEGITARPDARGDEVLTYTVPQDLTVLPYNFQSIFAFICNFNAASPTAVVDKKAALITAEMPDYIFVLTKEKQIPVTPPLGVLFDPYENECRKCGDGTFEECDTADECHQRSNYDPTIHHVGTCYYEYAGTSGSVASPQVIFGNPCHSCSPNFKCENLITQKSCDEEARVCSASCYWDTTARRPGLIDVNPSVRGGSLDPNAGACVEKVVPGPSVTGITTGGCASVPANFKTAYERRKDVIATAITVEGLDARLGPDATALVAAVISEESRWNERVAPGDGGTAFGLMQVRIGLHPECASLGDVKNDPVANIRCGVKILSDLSKRDIARPKTWACNGATYTGIDAILRYYNGWPDPCPTDPARRGDVSYVSNVRTGTGNLNNWLDCF